MEADQTSRAGRDCTQPCNARGEVGWKQISRQLRAGLVGVREMRLCRAVVPNQPPGAKRGMRAALQRLTSPGPPLEWEMIRSPFMRRSRGRANSDCDPRLQRRAARGERPDRGPAVLPGNP